jgi:hypothetical protein
MAPDPDGFGKQVDALLNLPDEGWLLGAGISVTAGIPLMGVLTECVQQALVGDYQAAFVTMRKDLHAGTHVEHVLTHVGDLIAIERSQVACFRIGQTGSAPHGSAPAIHDDVVRKGARGPERRNRTVRCGGQGSAKGRR